MQISSNIQINQQTPGAGKPDQGGLFQNMRPGQKMTVEVVSTESGSLTLKTNDGQLIKADFPGATVMMPGDQLELTMLEKGTGNVRFQLSMVNGQSVQINVSEMEAKMSDLGVQPSEMNVKAAEFLAERGVQPTPERIALLTKIVTYFPELPASAALFMVANNVPITRSNVNALMEWLHGGDMLGENAKQLTEAVQQMVTGQQEQGQTTINQVEQQQTPQQATSMQQGPQLSPQAAEIMKESFVSHVIRNPEFPGNTISLGSLTEFAQGLADMSEGDAQAAIKQFLNGYASLDAQQRADVGELLTNAYHAAKAAATAQTAGQVPAQAGQMAEQPQVMQPMQQEIAPQGQGGQAAEAAQQPAADGGQANTAQQAATGQAAGEQQATAGQTQGEQQAQAPAAQAGGEAAPQNVRNANEVMQQAAQTNTPGAAADEIKQVIQQLQKLVVSMKNDVLADAENLQETVKNQQQVTDSIKSSLASIAGESSSAAQKAADMSSRVQLGNSIENFYYCQVPFQVGQDTNTAELYVFERKKDVDAGEKTNTTILIALETQHMGRVETVMRAEQEVLNIEFRVETAPVQRYLERTVEELNEMLKSNDFAVAEIRVVRLDTPATPLNVDQVLGEKEEFELKTIDISI